MRPTIHLLWHVLCKFSDICASHCGFSVCGMLFYSSDSKCCMQLSIAHYLVGSNPEDEMSISLDFGQYFFLIDNDFKS